MNSEIHLQITGVKYHWVCPLEMPCSQNHRPPHGYPSTSDVALGIGKGQAHTQRKKPLGI